MPGKGYYEAGKYAILFSEKGCGYMGCLGNLIWFFCGGLLQGLSWTLAGLLWCITIIGIPFGLQCFKIAKLALMPFGATIVRNS